MSQNSFIKQYLEKQQELLQQRLEREAREAAELEGETFFGGGGGILPHFGVRYPFLGCPPPHPVDSSPPPPPFFRSPQLRGEAAPRPESRRTRMKRGDGGRNDEPGASGR